MSFLNHLISGISLGSIYAIIALGYTMVYGIAKMLNFAHGDVIMVGGYMCFCATTYLGWPAWMGVVLAVIVCTALGVVIERLAYKPLRMAPSLAVLITAIGVSYFLQNAALLIWSSNPKTFTSVVTGEALSLFGGQLQISKVTLVAIAACVVIMVALMLFTGKSKVGTAMRAVSEDKGAAQLMGINVNTTISMAQDERRDNARPQITLNGDADALESAGTIFLGYPIWWGDAPMPIYTFLEGRDWAGKTIHPFCTHEGSGLGSTPNNIADATGAIVKTGLAVRGTDAQNNADKTAKAVSEWIAKAGL